MAPTTLFQTLVDQDSARLRVIAQQWNIPLTAKRPVDQAAELADSMARADAIERIVQQLPPSQRAALDDMLRRGGVLPWAVYTHTWGHIRTLGHGKIEREALWQHPESVAEALWFSGLVHRTYGEHENLATELAFVPEELLLYMPEPPKQPLPAIPSTKTPNRMQSGVDGLADDMVTYFSVLQIQQVEGIRRQSIEALLRCIHAPAERRQVFLQALSLEKGWVRGPDEARPRLEDLRLNREPVLAWLKADLWAQWHTLIEAWLTSRWDDLAHVPSLAPDPSHGWYHRPKESRQRLLKAFAQCEAQTWYDLNTLCEYFKEHLPFILRPDGNFDTWALRKADGGMSLRGFDNWDAVEGAYIRATLTGPMHWLGLVDIGLASDGSATHVQLSEVGYAILHQMETPALSTPAALTISLQGKITVPAQQRFERFQLNRIAALGNDRAPYFYRFTPNSLALARKQRISLKRILEFLEQASAKPVPDSLKATLERAYSAAHGAEIAVQWVLRVPDADILKAPALQPYIVERLGETAALIRAGDTEKLLDLLTEHGILTELST